MKTISGKYYAYPCIRRMEDFQTKSKNFWAKNYDDGYFIFSYRTCIAQYSDGIWYINDASYSVETRKHQQEIRLALGYKFLDDNAIHLNYCIRGIQDLTYYARTAGIQRRIDRIKKQGFKPGVGKYYRYYESWWEKNFGGKHDDRWDYV